MMDEKPSERLPLERARQILEQGTLGAEQGIMRFSSNYTFLLSAVHEDVSVMAVYKPRKGERPLWDFPDGTLCQREVAAYHTSEALGWQLVPPTVLREGPRGEGSLQLFIDHDPEQNYFAFDETMIPQILRVVAFDYIANNADRKGGHCIVDHSGHLWGIDHGLTFHTDHKLRTVIWDFADDPVPEPLLADIEQFCDTLEDDDSDYRTAIAEFLSPREITALQARVHRFLTMRRFPTPGPGPNYPWPPV